MVPLSKALGRIITSILNILVLRAAGPLWVLKKAARIAGMFVKRNNALDPVNDGQLTLG
jgi:hypothetical protein